MTPPRPPSPLTAGPGPESPRTPGGACLSIDAALSEMDRLLPAILAAIPSRRWSTDPMSWEIAALDRSLTDVTIARVGPPGQEPVAIVRLPTGAMQRGCTARHWNALQALWRDARLVGWHHLLPEPLAASEVYGRPYVVEGILPGYGGHTLVNDGATRPRLLPAAAATIRELHNRTASPTSVHAGHLERWLAEPLATIEGMRQVAAPRQGLQAAAAELRHRLDGATVQLGWVHGDYWPCNLLCSADGAAITGIVDWDLAGDGESPAIDVIHLVLETRKLRAGHVELGETVSAFLQGNGWTAEEEPLLALDGVTPLRALLGDRLLVVFYWLRFMAAYLRQSPERTENESWVARNIDLVLATL